MNNKLILLIATFISTTAIPIELTKKLAEDLNQAQNSAQRNLDDLYSNQAKDERDFWRNQRAERIKDALWLVKILHPSLSDKDIQALASTFFTELQVASQEKAYDQVKYYIQRGMLKHATETINMHNRLCKNFIQSHECDCAEVHQNFKQILAQAIQEKHEQLDKEIQNAPNKLQQSIEREIRDSEQRIARNKQTQKNLDKIWQSLD